MEAMIIDKKTRDFYESEVKRYINYIKDPSDRRFHYYNYRWVLKHVKSRDRVLDVGCGGGILAYLLNQRKVKVCGIDISKNSIEHCKKYMPNLEFKESSIYSIPYNEEFDVVASNQLLEHLKEPERAIKEMIRVLKPGGTLLITVPIGHQLDLSRDVGHVQHWDFYQIMDLFKKFGDDFKIYFINKWNQNYKESGEPRGKNCFAIKWIKKKI